MTTIALTTNSLTRTFEQQCALNAVSISVPAGRTIGLLGPNGSGKTTLFRILATLLPPTGGTAEIFGHDVVLESHAVRRMFGVVFQNPSLDKKLTATENLVHHGELFGVPRAQLRTRINELLARYGLASRGRDLIETYSGGMARRVEIAKSLLHRPKLLLLDEPSTGLDPGARRDMWDQLADLSQAEGVTIFFTTHLMEEAERASELIILDKGQVVASGTPDELKARVGGDVIRIAAADPSGLRNEIVARFGGEAVALDGTVRIERARGHEFVPQLVEAFPGRVTAISVGKPTLEDVFIRVTGHRLYKEEGESA